MAKQPPASNAELGMRIGCSPSMASRLRSGRRRPSLDMAIRILSVHGVPSTAWPKALQALAEGGTPAAELFARMAPAPAHESNT